MNLMLNIDLKKASKQINYKDKILLTGSCFTEHIGNSLEELKFSTLQNPNGILFDPVSVCSSIISYIEDRQYGEDDLFYLNELWHSWQHHSRFSNIDKQECLRIINDSQSKAYDFLKKADWIIITLGSAFSYRLIQGPDSQKGEVNGVANCHRAPAQWFNKHLLGIDEIITALDTCYHRLVQHNPKISIILTVSPVRHYRDGVVDNNRSKARLIEAVHYMVDKYNSAYYFPAYELVIDILRDYRFYDSDLVHPNYLATEIVLEKFTEIFIDEESSRLMSEIKKIAIAKKHKPFQPLTNAHKEFLRTHADKARELMKQYPGLNLTGEIDYFMSS